MFGSIGLYLKLAVLLALAFALLYIKDLRTQVALDKVNIGIVQSAYDAEKSEVANKDKDLQAQRATNSQLADIFAETDQERSALEKKLNAAISQMKTAAVKDPKAVEVKINQGTVNALRCNELSTGSPLTADEKSGKTKNPVCQALLDSQVKGASHE